MRHVHKWWLGPLCFAALLLEHGEASAQAPTRVSSALAEARFQEGRDLFKQERFTEACAKFEESQKLEPKLGTLLRLALCHKKIGKSATAWAEFMAAAAIASREEQEEREELARKEIETLSKVLAHVIIKVSTPAPGLIVTLDDSPVDAAYLNKPLPIDPGTHHIAATAHDKKKWSTVFEIPSTKAEIPVEIPVLESLIPTQPPPPGPPQTGLSPAGVLMPAPVVPAPKLATQPSDRTGITLAYVGFGGGAAGLLVGAIMGSMALGQAGPLLEACPRNKCPEEQGDELAAVNTIANVANVGFGIGIVGAVVGIVGVAKASRSPIPTTTGAYVIPVVGLGTFGIQARF